MKRERLSIATVSASLFVLMLATMLASDAQTWQWSYVTRTPNTPPVAAQSTVAVSTTALRMAYTVPLQHRQVIIESCTADLHDVASATTIRAQGTAYLLVRFKPSHSAACASGKRPGVALPANDYGYIKGVAAAINRTCCSLALRAAQPRPSASPTTAPSGSPLASPSPSPSPSPNAIHLQDWVENEGLFSFVRIRNRSRTPVTISGDVFDCRNAAGSCGAFARGLQLAGRSTATVAAIASRDRHGLAQFRYRYTATSGSQTFTGAANSGKAAPLRAARMSPEELRSAQADAIGGMRSEQPAGSAPIVPARLVKRGSSRLAIGQTGTALLRVSIAANGTPEEATIVSISNKRLTAAAIETAVSSTYAPAKQNGRNVAAKYIATFAFDGEDPALASVPLWKRAPTAVPTTSPAPSPVPSPTSSPAPVPSPMPS